MKLRAAIINLLVDFDIVVSLECLSIRFTSLHDPKTWNFGTNRR
jgi:hypothetical protein